MTLVQPERSAPPAAYSQQRVVLVDLLDRVLGQGVVLTGDLTLSIADVDLVRISLDALITSVRAAAPGLGEPPA